MTHHDPVYGGWFQYLNPATLAPTQTDKGNVWTFAHLVGQNHGLVG